ncbi:MAG: DUF3460 family protein [Polaromonas sp.]|nr:DUF3460 family protein [Polaromonas sp.]
MNFFRRPDYNSEVTNFINDLKVQKPTLEAEQRAGRALLWDKPRNPQDDAAWGEATVAQQPYVYSTGTHPNAK